MKRLFLLSLLFVGASAWADDHGDDKAPSSIIYQPVPQPVYVPQPYPVPGPTGAPGRNGTNGVNGQNGTNGRDGQDASSDTHYTGRASVRVLDTKRWTFGIYDTYDFRDGHNQELGVEAVLKIGKSYEERRIEQLEKLVQDLSTIKFLEGRHETK